MRDFDIRMGFCCLGFLLVTFFLAPKAYCAEETVTEEQEELARKSTPFNMLMIVVPKACAQVYPDDEIKKKAASIEYGFIGHLDSPESKERWGAAWILTPDATEEMRRNRQARIDKEWAKMAEEAREFFAPERVACVTKNLQLDKNQCEEFVNALSMKEPPEPTKEQIRKMSLALEATLDPCVPLVKNWPGKDDRPSN